MKAMQQILTKLANEIIAHLSHTLSVYSLVPQPHLELKSFLGECLIEKLILYFPILKGGTGVLPRKIFENQ